MDGRDERNEIKIDKIELKVKSKVLNGLLTPFLHTNSITIQQLIKLQLKPRNSEIYYNICTRETLVKQATATKEEKEERKGDQ